MYVIGSNCYNYITVTTTTMWDGIGVWREIVKVEHEVPLHKSTISANLEDAEKILKEIQDRVDEIQFQNYSIIGEVIDKNGSFDKAKFVKELKVYELVPREVME